MRDTAIALMAFLGLAGLYHFLNRTNPNLSPVAQVSHSSTTRHRSRLAKAGRHDSRTNPNEAKRIEKSGTDLRENGEETNDIAKSEELGSIYAQREKTPVVTTAKDAQAANPAKVLYGVPLQAWILSHRDSLNMPVVAQNTAGGVRVFLQCLELKNQGAEYLGERGCEKILNGSNPVKLEHETNQSNWFPIAMGGS